MAEQLIGHVMHFFGKASVAAIKITVGELHVGDTIHVVGHTSDFTQTVDSMQVNKASVQLAKPGDEIGLKVVAHARESDEVFRVAPD
jgi:translation elongation factor EF-1alpha